METSFPMYDPELAKRLQETGSRLHAELEERLKETPNPPIDTDFSKLYPNPISNLDTPPIDHLEAFKSHYAKLFETRQTLKNTQSEQPESKVQNLTPEEERTRKIQNEKFQTNIDRLRKKLPKFSEEEVRTGLLKFNLPEHYVEAILTEMLATHEKNIEIE